MKLHCNTFSVVKDKNKYSYNVFMPMIDLCIFLKGIENAEKK